MHVGLLSRRARAAHDLTAWAGHIGAAASDTDHTALQKRLAVVLCAGTLPLTALWSAIYLLAHAPLAAAIPAFYTLVTPWNTALFAWTRNFAFYRFTQLLLILILPWLVTIALGGFRQSSVVIIWAALCPLGSLLLEEPRRTVLWIVGFVALLVATALLQGHLTPAHLSDTFVTWFFVLNVGSVVAITFGLLHHFVGARNFFQERSEMLLLNILPKEICEALKTQPRAIAAHYDSASILFADIVEFTPMAATMAPLSLVDLLNEVFQCFDALVDKYDLEKIKTIGDCYMVAAGVPRPRADHAQTLVNLALDMRAEVNERTFAGRRLAFRIGINSGPVVAGVIGRKKFIYDLWGDTVNMASRMESHGQSGIIQITRNTFDLVGDEFDCQARGTIEVKGAGRVETWCVTGRKPAGERPPRGTWYAT
ncbi:MAG: adenylate/guanylate cyclase domain-containing protein [Mycobacterium sp.]|uniref:adenylate/guanylate cyclase domain-containing protein n=1 Tax=Mycobacterium sp. TaxID=1785 RepID=UPI002614E11A|nr:adenylate/guanylate cyclase domain-containing protein [Mycobacterium sp.]MDI3314902.1 adenylate/guanylate cyclase domain-containing protein [Mycobacterium sp.]